MSEETNAEEINSESGSEETRESNNSEENGNKKASPEEIGNKNTGSEEIGNKKEEDGADRSIIEEVCAKDFNHLALEIAQYLADFFDEEVEYNLMTDQVKHEVVEFTINDKIRFRQIIDIDISIKENCENAQGSYERNLRVYEKLSVEYMTKHGQEIMFMDQAEVKSIKTVKEVEKPTKWFRMV